MDQNRDGWVDIGMDGQVGCRCMDGWIYSRHGNWMDR